MLEEVLEGSRYRVGLQGLPWLALVAVLGILLAFAPAAVANGNITFSGSPGTQAPPATLGPYQMTPFAPDATSDGTMVSGVTGPIGAVGFSLELTKATVPGGGWNNWSNGYASSVYYSDSQGTLTIQLPPGTAAFYLYLEPDNFSTTSFTVTAEDGEVADTTSSGPIGVTSPNEASYFGFYATGGQTISSVAISSATTANGIAIGEFGIAALAPTVASGSAADITTSTAQLTGTVDPNGISTSSHFEYGTTTKYGETAPSPAAKDGNGSEPITASVGVSGLQPGTTYHYRLVAVNRFGETTDGADETFTTVAATPTPAPSSPSPTPASPSPTPSSPAPTPTPPVVGHCSVPKLSHLSPAAAKTALIRAGCELGKVKKEKRPKGTAGLSYGVVAESPSAGSVVALNGKVNVTLGWFKSPKPRGQKH